MTVSRCPLPQLILCVIRKNCSCYLLTDILISELACPVTSLYSAYLGNNSYRGGLTIGGVIYLAAPAFSTKPVEFGKHWNTTKYRSREYKHWICGWFGCIVLRSSFSELSSDRTCDFSETESPGLLSLVVHSLLRTYVYSCICRTRKRIRIGCRECGCSIAACLCSYYSTCWWFAHSSISCSQLRKFPWCGDDIFDGSISEGSGECGEEGGQWTRGYSRRHLSDTSDVNFTWMNFISGMFNWRLFIYLFI